MCVEDRVRSVGTESLLELCKWWCFVCSSPNLHPLFFVQRDGCPKIVNLGSSKTDLFYERKKYGFKKRWSHPYVATPPIGLARGSWNISGLYCHRKPVDYFFLKQYKFSSILGVGEITDWVGTETWSELTLRKSKWGFLSLAFSEALLVAAPAHCKNPGGQVFTRGGDQLSKMQVPFLVWGNTLWLFLLGLLSIVWNHPTHQYWGTEHQSHVSTPPPPFLQYISMLPCFVRNLLMAGAFLGRAQLLHVFFDRLIQGPFL